MFDGVINDLVGQLKQLPGIGNKTAQRLAIFLLQMPKSKSQKFVDVIEKAIDNITNCSICNMLSEEDPCRYCSDSNRHSDEICVVENTLDILLIENTKEFQGRYFVLGNLLSPLDGIGPEEIHFSKLREHVMKNQVKELILALNPSIEGESTIGFVSTQLEDLPVNITRLSTGLPFGGDLEYTNQITLGNAFKRRFAVKEL
jgi:recombination protein RecR